MAILPFSKKIIRKICCAGPSGFEEYQINLDEFFCRIHGKTSSRLSIKGNTTNGFRQKLQVIKL
jgi:hypothetical protein